jgi:hypothetical protein
MSASPPKDVEVEPGAQSPEEEQMEHQDTQAQGIGGFELEVKEQDRWLPIANGWCLFQHARAFVPVLFTCTLSHCRLTIAIDWHRFKLPILTPQHARASCLFAHHSIKQKKLQSNLSCPMLPHNHRPLTRNPQTKVLHQMLTFITLLQSLGL